MWFLTWKYSLIKVVGPGTERECFPYSPSIEENHSEIQKAIVPETKGSTTQRRLKVSFQVIY